MLVGQVEGLLEQRLGVRRSGVLQQCPGLRGQRLDRRPDVTGLSRRVQTPLDQSQPVVRVVGPAGEPQPDVRQDREVPGIGGGAPRQPVRHGRRIGFAHLLQGLAQRAQRGGRPPPLVPRPPRPGLFQMVHRTGEVPLVRGLFAQVVVERGRLHTRPHPGQMARLRTRRGLRRPAHRAVLLPHRPQQLRLLLAVAAPLRGQHPVPQHRQRVHRQPPAHQGGSQRAGDGSHPAVQSRSAAAATAAVSVAGSWTNHPSSASAAHRP
ncbi:hypothetical protein O1L44_05805 [Streptomyces noursei]|nr:hypothetical protein [Streptomyces noursei]